MPYACTDIANYLALDCGVDAFAYGRITGLAILTNQLKDFTFEDTWSDYIDIPTNPATADMIFVKDVRGEYDGGEPSKKEGYGRLLEIVASMKHKATFELEYNRKNKPFFESLLKTTNAGIAWVTAAGSSKGGELEVVDVPVSFSAKTPIPKNIEEVRMVMIEATWSKIGFPVTINLPANTAKSVTDLFF